jgi:hypothetical protein
MFLCCTRFARGRTWLRSIGFPRRSAHCPSKRTSHHRRRRWRGRGYTRTSVCVQYRHASRQPMQLRNETAHSNSQKTPRNRSHRGNGLQQSHPRSVRRSGRINLWYAGQWVQSKGIHVARNTAPRGLDQYRKPNNPDASPNRINCRTERDH